MKTKTTLLAIAVCAVIQAAALAGQPPKAPVTQNQLSASQNVTPTANAATTVRKPLIITPLNKSLPVQKTDIYRFGNISSRAWTESVGWNPGTPSMAYDSGGGKEQGLTLFWIGSEPSR